MENTRFIPVTVTKREKILGLCYLPIEFYLLPLALVYCNQYLNLTETELNIGFFCLNFVAIMLIFNKFLWRSLRMAANHFWASVQAVILGAVAYFASAWVIAAVVLFVDPNFQNVNDASIMYMADKNFPVIAFCTIVLVPITEECLFRGVIFGSMHNSRRIAAFALSTLLFAAVHILGFVSLADPKTLLLCFLQYLPAGIWLGWSYEKSGTIIVPMVIHAFVNFLGLNVMR